MNTSSKHLPALVGTILLVVGVGVAGASFVQDNRPDDWSWLRAVSAPFGWKLTPGNVPFDVYVGFNLVPVVFVVVSAGLIFLVSSRVAGGFVPTFFAVWGAVVAGGVVAAVVSVLYNKVILDLPSFTPAGGTGFLDEVQYGIDVVLDAAAFAGLWVAVAVAVMMLVAGPSHPAAVYAAGEPANPYAGSPLDPSPPMTPMPPPPPPTTVQPSVTPPPPPGSADPTIVADDATR